LQNERKPVNLSIPHGRVLNEKYSDEYFSINPIKDEANLWLSKRTLKDQVAVLLEITLAGHNNVAGFEIFGRALESFINKELF
jgi:hypothetical protein